MVRGIADQTLNDPMRKTARRVDLRYAARLSGLLCSLRSPVTHRSRSVALSARRRSRSWLHVSTKQLASTPSSVTIAQSASGKLVLSLCQYGLRLSGFFETTSSPRSSCTNTYLRRCGGAEGEDRDRYTAAVGGVPWIGARELAAATGARLSVVKARASDERGWASEGFAAPSSPLGAQDLGVRVLLE